MTSKDPKTDAMGDQSVAEDEDDEMMVRLVREHAEMTVREVLEGVGGVE